MQPQDQQQQPTVPQPTQPGFVPNPQPVQPVSQFPTQPLAASPFPTQPTIPAPVVMPGMQVPNGLPKKSKTGLIVGLIVGGVVLLAGIGVAIFLILNMRVSKADYQAASDKYAEFSTAYGVAEHTSTANATSSEIDAYISDVASTQTKLAELGKLKAVQNDKDIKPVYDKLNSKASQFLKRELLSAGLERTLTEDCGDMATRTGVQECLDGLNKVDTGDWTSLNTMVTALKAYLQTALDGKKPDSTAFSAATAQLSSEAKTMVTDVESASSDLKEAIYSKLSK